MLSLEPSVGIPWERASLGTNCARDCCNNWSVQTLEFQFLLALYNILVHLQPDSQRVQFDITKWPLATPTSPCSCPYVTVYTIPSSGMAQLFVCHFDPAWRKKCAGQFFSWINSLIYFIIWLHAQTELICIEEQDSTLQGLKCVAKLRPTSAVSQYCCRTYRKARPHLEWVSLGRVFIPYNMQIE